MSDFIECEVEFLEVGKDLFIYGQLIVVLGKVGAVEFNKLVP